MMRWRSRERDVGEPCGAPVDVDAEWKRLRRKNAVLKQSFRIRKRSGGIFPANSDIFKKAAPSSRERDVAGERHRSGRARRG